MKIKFWILVLVTTLFSCSINGEYIKSELVYKEFSDLCYIEPIYSFESKDALKSERGQGFIKYTNKVIDSIFLAKPQKYKVNQKVKIDEKYKSDLNLELIEILKKIESHKTLENIPIPEKFSTIDKSKLEFLMVSIIKPTLISAEEKFSNSIVLGSNDQYFSVDSSELSILIFDLSKNKTVFYGKTSGKLNDMGYRKKIINDLNSIYKSLKK